MKKVRIPLSAISFKKLASRIPPSDGVLATPTLLRGSNIKLFSSTHDLGIIEQSAAFGLNTSAMYGLKTTDAPVGVGMGITARLYGAFPEKLPKIKPPTFEEFVTLVRKANPGFEDYQAGPLLGIDKNSVYRIRDTGFDKCKEGMKLLIILIYDLLKEDLRNWDVIAEAVEVEAASRGLDEKKIWRTGRWRTAEKKEAEPKQIKKPAIEKTEKAVRETRTITKEVIWN